MRARRVQLSKAVKARQKPETHDEYEQFMSRYRLEVLKRVEVS